MVFPLKFGAGCNLGLIAFLGIAVFACVPSDAYAVFTIASCAAAGGFPPEAISGPIVYCIEATVRNSAITALNQMSVFFKGTISVVLVLALTMQGVSMMSGERNMTAKSMGFILRLIFVTYFSFNLGGIAGYVFAIADQVLSVSLGGYVPWPVIDAVLQTLFGFAPGVAIFQGLMWLASGVLGGSGTASFLMSSTLLVTFIDLILFVIEIVYVFLMAYLVIAFMLIVSPMFIPAIMFSSTERYFKKWLDTILGAMLIPVFLFGFLFVSLGVVLKLVGSIFFAILPGYKLSIPPDPANPPDFTAFWKMSMPSFSWNMPTDPNYTSKLAKAVTNEPGVEYFVSPNHIIVNPYNRGGFQLNAYNPPGFNFGMSDKSTNQRLIFALISLWLYIAVMKELIKKMPEVAQEIAGSASSITMQIPSIKDKVAELKENAVTGGGILAGAGLGAMAASGLKDQKTKQLGIMGGGAIGAMLARRTML